jgi:aldehyde:ferredoxin oxidoreductase
MSAPHLAQAPRIVLEVDVARLFAGASDAVRRGPWRPQRAGLAGLASAGGGALGFAWIAQHAVEHPDAPSPLVVSVGDAVRRGVPTAARASVASRAPLTGLFAEGLVGGGFARRLASLADALVLHSSDDPREVRGDALVVDGRGARLERFPQLVGASAKQVHAFLREHFAAHSPERSGEFDVLAIGAAGERGVRFANLAASGETPHFVGRGGLGAVLGGLGLKAVVVLAPSVPTRSDSELTRALLRSPRLAVRAEAGTFEQLPALQASGELRERGFRERIGGERVERLEASIEAAKAGAHGCHGCPTPCGWVFRTDSGERQGARFGASYALGLNLGLERFEDALALLAVCDEVGLDAKESGAALALLARARELGLEERAPHFGRRAEFERVLRAAASAPPSDPFARLFERGPAAIAAHYGLEGEHTCVKGASARPDDNLASLLGQCVSSRGGDSMRAFPFAAFDPALLAAWGAGGGFEWPAGALDPRSSAGKGLVVAWHEDWSNALDALGFCSFSAAALLTDRVLSLAELERVLAPELVACDGAGALLRLGAELTLAQRELNARWGARERDERPPWAREKLEQEGVWPQYAAVREAQRAGRWSYGPVDFATPDEDGAQERPAEERRLGRVTLRFVGALAGELGREVALETPLECRVAELLERVARLRAVASAPGTSKVSVFRAGRLLRASDPVRADDVLDLVAVLSGG